MVNRISVEVIAPVLTDLRHCEHCEIIFGLTRWGKWCIIDLTQKVLR